MSHVDFIVFIYILLSEIYSMWSAWRGFPPFTVVQLVKGKM